ncbi:LysR family transcriptional regulator [Burkholderia cenocepacia]|jgi:LysR family cyn operon transcriptional activator|nr:bacterial regulatory helix-turn-helix, lysR family protein [Burkholderia cepacia]MCW3527494.1 LysR family transcriptional regulator [Burkholderia cenocepacia]KGC05181.1 bacterial regulatory helix-turn-helix, lysR family protein [Burkholderia cepacia]MCW3617534.1 LysR family transcriptional regulator [Burkholderia cenocepacia]MCW3655429.1 LysR family transcriptional regulator [Burkholderia cenocepacia]
MKYMDHQLRLFLVIAQSPSLSAAAEALDLTQSSLSKQLSALESYVGQPLFERHGRGVSLSDAGRRLLNAARPAYELIDSCVTQMREQQGITEGSLRVATIHTLSYYFLADVMAKFMGQRPKVNMTLLGRSSPEVVDLVETGKADLGFVYDTAVATDEVSITPLFDEEMSLVVHEDSNFAELDQVSLTEHDVPLIVFPQNYALRRMLTGQIPHINIAAEVDTVDAMLQLTSVTAGQCILPGRMPTKLLQEYHLKRVKIVSPVLTRRIVAITRRGRVQSPLLTLLLDIAQTTLK